MSRNTPKVWNNIFSPLAEEFGPENVIIAGGCIRDRVLGIAPKDIDVFLNIEYPVELEMVAKDLKDAGLNINTGTNEAGDDNYEALEEVPKSEKASVINGIYAGSVTGSTTPVNIILRQFNHMPFNPENLVSTFDYSMVQGWYDPKSGDVTGTDAFKRDIEAKVFNVPDFIKNDEKKFKKTCQRIRKFCKRAKLDVPEWAQLDSTGWIDWEAPVDAFGKKPYPEGVTASTKVQVLLGLDIDAIEKKNADFEKTVYLRNKWRDISGKIVEYRGANSWGWTKYGRVNTIMKYRIVEE